MVVAATPVPAWQQRAKAAFAAVQSKIPSEWRLPEKLLAPAWVYPEDCDASQVEKDVRHVFEECGILDDLELRIVKTDAPVLLQRMASKEWTALQVMTAFCKSAAIAQQLFRCCTELFFERSLEKAKKVDEEFARTGKTSGMLHGLPISLKDEWDLKGIRTSIGLSSMLDNFAKKDAAIVTALESQGAIIFVKTNVPMSLMSADAVNAIWGRCVNPLDRTRTAGGSSGGEASLIRAFGSPLGVASDIAGSIRIPSAMCGTYGFKPSPGRLPTAGGPACGSGAEFIPPVNGPIGRSLDSLELFMRAVVSTKPWMTESDCVPMPWMPVDLKQKSLRIGVLRDNGLVRPHPPITRALRDVESALKAAGHTVVDWDAAEVHAQAHSLAKSFFRQDGGASLDSMLGDEPCLPNVDTGRPESLLSGEQILHKYWQAFELRAQYLQKWRALDLDAVICPVASHVASQHNKYNDISNTLPWNTLQYPITVIPVSQVSEADVEPNEEYEAYQPRPTQLDSVGINPERGDRENKAMWLDESDRKGTVGLPICIQIACPTHMDEQCLAIARVIHELVN